MGNERGIVWSWRLLWFAPDAWRYVPPAARRVRDYQMVGRP